VAVLKWMKVRCHVMLNDSVASSFRSALLRLPGNVCAALLSSMSAFCRLAGQKQ
jgi:hypothetical protein